MTIPKPGERRPVQDFMVAAAQRPVTNPDDEARVRRMITGFARQYVWKQYVNPPCDIEFLSIDVTITGSAIEAAQFRIIHDCEDCREGLDKAVHFLADNPGKFVTLTNISYIEEWP